LLLDKSIMHLEADLRWLDITEMRLDEVKRQPLPEPEVRPRGRPKESDCDCGEVVIFNQTAQVTKSQNGHGMSLISAENLTKIYGSGDTAVTALDHVNLNVNAGEFVAVMGPSGCGKSTLLHLLGGLDQPSPRQRY
jgi:ABC-type glutathione transport system ATPase component